MNSLIVGFIIGMLVTYTWIYPDNVKRLCGNITEQVKKLLGRK